MIPHFAMSRLFLCSMLAVVLGSNEPARGDDAKSDKNQLQGTWQVTAGVSDGKPIPKDQLERMKIVFAGEKMSLFPPDGKKALESTFVVDSSKEPKAIDTTRAEGGARGKTANGIYELDGDTLKLCLPVRLDKERPTAFAAPENSGQVLLTLKRVKK